MNEQERIERSQMRAQSPAAGIESLKPSRDEVAIYKHLKLHEAIMSIEIVVNDIDLLRNKIKGVGEDGEKAPQPDLPTLQQVLDDGPEYIFKKTDELREKINEIDSLLF